MSTMSNFDDDHSEQCKKKQVLVMGLPEVGKTSIVEQIHETNSELPGRKYHHIKKLVSSIEFTEAIDYNFKSFRKRAIHHADAIILVYSVEDIQSFDYVAILLEEIAAIKGSEMPVVVVANKTDGEFRDIHPIIADCVVTIDFECSHVEASAENGDGMKQVFSELLQKLGEKPIIFEKDENNKWFRQTFAKMSLVFKKQ
ncbi:hypothetical protein ACF0H5_004807 [Mactra antiquata]